MVKSLTNFFNRIPFLSCRYKRHLFKGVPWNDRDSNFGVVLSFDMDYREDEDAVGHLLEVLEQFNIKSGFAAIGKMVNDNPAVYKSIVNNGHELINHSMTHPYHKIINNQVRWNELDIDKMKNEISSADEIIYQVTGYKPIGFRAPHFEYQQPQFALLRDMGYKYDSSGFYSEKGKYESHPFRIDDILEIPIYRTLSSYYCLRRMNLDEKEWLKRLKISIDIEKNRNGLVNFYFDPMDIIKVKDTFIKMIEYIKYNNGYFSTYPEIIKIF